MELMLYQQCLIKEKRKRVEVGASAPNEALATELPTAVKTEQFATLKPWPVGETAE